MKKVNVNGKKINNKIFVLLLAVVVVLAVVMAVTKILLSNAEDTSSGDVLQDTAIVIADAFNQKYKDYLVSGDASDVYGDVLGPGHGYNFQNNATYYINENLADTFNISIKDYALNSFNTIAFSGDATTALEHSFVKFDVSTSKFVVCMFANKKGSYFVDNFKVELAEGETTYAIGTTGQNAATGTMYACSDKKTKSW